MNNITQKKKNLLRNRKGFTLIELIVVIVIIGILAAIVIPRLAGFSDTAADRANLATARTIYSAAAAAQAEDADNKYSVSVLADKGYLETEPETGFSVSYDTDGYEITVTYPTTSGTDGTYPADSDDDAS